MDLRGGMNRREDEKRKKNNAPLAWTVWRMDSTCCEVSTLKTVLTGTSGSLWGEKDDFIDFFNFFCEMWLAHQAGGSATSSIAT